MLRTILLTTAVTLGTLGTAMAQSAEPDAQPTGWVLAGSYTGEFWTNTQGGLRRGGKYLDNVNLRADYLGGTGRLKGLRGTIGLLYNNGTSFSGDFVGDTQGISNIETGVRALRLYETWLAYDWENGLGLKAGVIDLNTEFDAPGVSALFLNPSHGIVPTFSQTGVNGPSIFPILGLGLVGRAQIGNWTTKLGVFDAAPGDPNDPKQTDLRLRSDDGTLTVGEVEGVFERARLVLGAWRYSEETAPILASGSADINSGFYGQMDYSINESFDVFLRGGTADEKLNPISAYVGTGAVWNGPMASRPDDKLGLAIAHARFGAPARSLMTNPARAETNYELTWALLGGEGVNAQLGLQYVDAPSGDRSTEDALTLGFRFIFSR